MKDFRLVTSDMIGAWGNSCIRSEDEEVDSADARIRQNRTHHILPRCSLYVTVCRRFGDPTYLTLPKGVPARTCRWCCIHGGALGSDKLGYDGLSLRQTVDMRVFRPNFRSSSWVWKASFLTQSNGQWGEKMQDSLTWVSNTLLRRVLSNPKRVGSGGSYGGYATPSRSCISPRTPLCGGSVDVRPSNLITLLEVDTCVLGIRPSHDVQAYEQCHTPEGKAKLELPL